MDAVTRMQGIYFLKHLEPDELEALARMMHLQEYVSGDAILTQGENTTNFYIVDSGYVNLRRTDQTGYEQAIGSKGPGDFFGVKMFTTQEPSEYTFEAVGTTAMWVMERQDWDLLLEQFPDVLAHMPELREEYARLTMGLNWLAPGEVIDLVTRRHPWSLFLMARVPLFIAIVFTIAYFISVRLGVTERLTWLPYVYYGTMIFVLLWAIWNGVNWFNDSYIVTNKRAVRINRVLFISDSRSEVPIEKIQQQQVERRGIISTLLNISDLHITSASATAAPLVFATVGNVERIQRAIEVERTRVAERNQAAEREHLRSMIAGEIRHYVLHEPPFPDPGIKAVAAMGWREQMRSIWGLRGGSAASLRRQLRETWLWLFGTEIRTEKTVTWRKHYVVLLRQIGLGLLIFFILLALFGFVVYSGAEFGALTRGIYLGMGGAIFAAFLVVVWQWLDWRVDLYRLTETQIIDIESLPFGLRYNEMKADLAKIQDVNVSRPHFINTLLDYGDVEVRTAGSSPPFTFNRVAHPSLVADELQKRIAILAFRNSEKDAREQTRQIVDAIVAYHRLVAAERQQNGGEPPSVLIVPAAAQPPESPASPPTAPVQTPLLSSDAEGEFPSESELPFE